MSEQAPEWTVTLEIASHVPPTQLAILVHSLMSVDDVRVVEGKRISHE